jgi:hypothetical protein
LDSPTYLTADFTTRYSNLWGSGFQHLRLPKSKAPVHTLS